MKKKKIFLLLIITIILFTLVISGIGNLKQNKKNGVILKKNVSVVTEGTKNASNLEKVTENELVFKRNPRYPKDEVLVAGITDVTPNGFIRKVIETTKREGKYIVKTENAVLTEVFEEVHIEKDFILKEEGAEELIKQDVSKMNNKDKKNLLFHPIVYAEEKEDEEVFFENIDDYDFAAEFEYKFNEDLRVAGGIGYNVWIELDLDIKKGNVIFNLVAHDKSEGGLLMEYSSKDEDDFEKELFSKDLPNFQFMVGPVPIVVTNEMAATVEGESAFEGKIETKLEIEASNAIGFKYNSKKNKVKEICERSYDSDGLNWEAGASVTCENSAGVYLHLITKLYDSTGVDMAVGIAGEIKGEVKMDVSKENTTPSYSGSLALKIGPKLTGNLVVTVPIIDRQLAKKELFEFEMKPFWEDDWKVEEPKREVIPGEEEASVGEDDWKEEEPKREVIPSEEEASAGEDAILSALQGGDFSIFAGKYKVPKELYELYGGTKGFTDLILYNDGTVLGGGQYEENPYPKQKPIKVSKMEDGSYCCTVQEEIIDYMDEAGIPHYIQGGYAFYIYPKGICEEIYLTPEMSFLKDTIYIRYIHIMGGVSDIVYYLDEMPEKNSGFEDYEEVD